MYTDAVVFGDLGFFFFYKLQHCFFCPTTLCVSKRDFEHGWVNAQINKQ